MNDETRGRNRRWVAAGLLLVITLAGGWAAGKTRRLTGLAESSETGLLFEASGRGPVHFSGRLDRGSVLAHGDGLVRMELLLAADDVAQMIRPMRVPTDLVVVLDRSGSMQGKPLHDAVASVRELIGRLGTRDRFALVTYASDVQLAIPLSEASAENRNHWIATVNRVASGGGTNMAVGIDLAADTIALSRGAGRMPRVILLSDGHANQGDHSLEGLRRRAGRAVAGEYVLSTIGVGQDFDERLMAALADAGTGNFYYVEDSADLGEVFAGEFDSARDTVASAVSVEIDLGAGVELLDAAGYPLERSGRLVRFHPGALFAGQQRHIWLTLRAPTVPGAETALGEFRLVYREADARPGAPQKVLRFAETPRVACVEDEEKFVASLDREQVLRGIDGDELAKLKRHVATDVQAGNLSAAKGRLEAYRLGNAAMYRSLRINPAAGRGTQAAIALEEKVDAAFASPAAPAARNSLSKTLSVEGQDGRRVGAKK